MPADGCSDAPVHAGTTRYSQHAADADNRTNWQLPTGASIV